MRFLLLMVVAGIALMAQRAPAQAVDVAVPARNAVADFVSEAARRFAIPEAWIYAVMRVESAGDPRAVSPKGATGLMQIMPGTWHQLRARYALGNDIFDPHDNIIAGAGYLRELYDRYGSPGFLAAYNAGPARYESYVARGTALPGETVAYVRKLAPVAAGDGGNATAPVAADPTAWTRSALFTRPSRDATSITETTATSAESTPLAGAPLPGKSAPPPASAGLFIPLSGPALR